MSDDVPRPLTIAKTPDVLSAPGTGSFTEKKINVSFTVGAGTFAGGGSGRKFSGLRVNAKIEQSGAPASAMLNCAIYGMKLADMLQIATLGQNINLVMNNTITVEAGDAVTGMSVVFAGTIIVSLIDGSSQPDVPLRVVAKAGGILAVQTVEPSSYDGSASSTTMLQSMAGKADPPLTLESNGTNVMLSSPYMSGSLLTQIKETIDHAGLFGGIDSDNKTLAVWPKNGFRAGGPVPISPTTGMLEYPSFSNNTLIFKALFNKAFKWGGQITVSQSQIPAANGTWVVAGLVHDLDSQTPDGQWFTTLIVNIVSGSLTDNNVVAGEE